MVCKLCLLLIPHTHTHTTMAALTDAQLAEVAISQHAADLDGVAGSVLCVACGNVYTVRGSTRLWFSHLGTQLHRS